MNPKLVPLEEVKAQLIAEVGLAEYERIGRELEEENARLLRSRVANNIKKSRLSAEVTQEELAKRLNTKKTYISSIENGKQNVSLEYMNKIAKALNKKLVVRIE